MFIPGRYFQPIQISVGKGPVAYPRVTHLKGVSFRLARALLTNIRLGWKSIPKISKINYDCKSFITLDPGINVLAYLSQYVSFKNKTL